MPDIETRSFLGIRIDGEIRSSNHTDQRPLEDLAPLLQAVLDDGGIEAFGWSQYTPYFNDGEPCVFSVGDAWFLTAEDADDEKDQEQRDDDPWTWRDAHTPDGRRGLGPTWHEYERDRATGQYRKVTMPNPNYNPARHDRCKALSDAINSGAFEAVCLAAFGDHAHVTITRDGITVDFYEHD